MKLELTDKTSGSAFIGDKLVVRTKFSFEEDTSILWSGVSLITNPPCKKDLQISKSEVFSKGKFEAGEYIREKELLIKGNVVPTIKKRNLDYHLQLLFRQVNPINPNDDLVIKRTKEIDIKTDERRVRAKEPNPISFSISGLNISLTKDVFKPGETMKINYSSQNLRVIEIRLLQKANLVCYCEAYGKNCRNIDELPPAIAGDVKTSNTKEGFLLLKVPEIAEPTHNYLWEPSEKEHWGMKYGDYSEWTLLILGKKLPEYGRDQIRFEVPVTILMTPFKARAEGTDLFSPGVTGGMNIFEDVSNQFQKRFKIISVNFNAEETAILRKYNVRLKNTSKETLKGVTVKLTGLQEGLFETAPQLTGLNSWENDEEKVIIYETKQKISAIISNIEDNSQKSVRIQTPISVLHGAF
jgi:hypothetical protein